MGVTTQTVADNWWQTVIDWLIKWLIKCGIFGLRMQANIRLFEYLNTEYYLNSKFDIQVFVCYNKNAYRA